MKKISIFFYAVLMAAFPLSAKITFENADINADDELLFTVKQEMSGITKYKSLMYAKIKDGEKDGPAELLTCYPEQMELLENGNTLQIRNHYGTARYNSTDSTFSWIKKNSELPLNNLPIEPYSVSADGRWFCKIEKTDICLGNLVLENAESGEKVILNENIVNSYNSVPVKWSSDSSILLYEKNGAVYFCNPEAMLKELEVEEKYRKIGRGTINCVEWASSKYIAYVNDYLLYKINARELYTVGLYAGIIGQGKPMGRLPFQFNPSTDRFSADKDVKSILIVQNERFFSYLKVESDSCDYMNVIYSRPYSDSSASLINSWIFWDSESNPVLWQSKLPYDGSAEVGAVYKIGSEAVQVLQIEDSGQPFLDPTGNRIAFFAGSVIYVYDINSWYRVNTLGGEKISSALWVNKNILYVGGEKTIRKWNVQNSIVDVVSLSSVTNAWWDNTSNAVIAESGTDNFYRYNSTKRTWSKVSTKAMIDVSTETQNGRYRVFTGNSTNKFFANILYVRSLSSSPVTKPFFKEVTTKDSELKKVALIFDAYDNPDGLTKIISALKKYNVKATFFINGEFISRYPSETKQIVANGYECGSMFFTTADLTDRTFVIDEDFIRRGLARNEDQFFACTGSELTLYWHAPYYKATDLIIQAGNSSNYTYVQPLLTKTDDSQSLIQTFYSNVKEKNGGIIPVTIGFSQSGTYEFLYNHLDLLICALLDEGFEFVSISEY